MSNLNFLHSGGNKVTLSAPDSNPSSDVTLKLPQAGGSSGQAMVTNGSGALLFASLGVTMADQWMLTSNYTFSNFFNSIMEVNYSKNFNDQ